MRDEIIHQLRKTGMHDNGGLCGVGENLCRREICDVVGRSGEGDESFGGGFVVQVEEGIVGGGIGGVVVVVGHWVGLWIGDGCSVLPLFSFFLFFLEEGGEEGRKVRYVYIMKEAIRGMKEGMKGMEGRKYMQRCLRARSELKFKVVQGFFLYR